MNQLVSKELSQSLWAVKASTEEMAAHYVEQDMGELHLNSTQKQAAVLTKQLEILTGPIDYTYTRIRGQIITELDKGDLWAAHPSSPGSLDELLHEAGVSKSERSDLMAWENHIYPYLEEHLSLSPTDIWLKLNKTKRRRITKYLRPLTDPDHKVFSDKVKSDLAHLRKEAGDSNTAIIEHILGAAETMTSSDLEEGVLSSTSTPEINMLATRFKRNIIDTDGEIIGENILYRVRFEASQDQMDMLRRRFPDRLYIITQNGEEE